MPAVSVSELAQKIGGTVVGDGLHMIHSCNSLMEAGPEQVSLLHNARYAKELDTTRAGCVILAPGAAAQAKRAAGLPPLTVIEAKNTYYAWQQAMVLLHGHRTHEPVGVSPLACVDKSAILGKNVHIHPYAVVGPRVSIGDNTHVYPQVTLMHDVSIGSDTVLYPGVTVYERCTIGNRCLINAGTVIGSDGTSFAQANGVHHKMPQSGVAVIEDDVEIGSNSVIERAALKTTTIGRGTKIGNCVVIGHNCQIGPGNMLISQVGMAGSTTTGKYVVMGGQVAVNGHLNIPDFVKIGAQAGVMTDPEPNSEILGSPAIDAQQMKRMLIHQMNLPDIVKRLKALEKKLASEKA